MAHRTKLYELYKKQVWCSLSDAHLKNLILLSNSKINPDIDKLVIEIQVQKTH